MAFDPKTLTLYPTDPGVYLMKDTLGNVLYVGKAKNLKNRLKQYFAKKGDERVQVPYLTAQVDAIETVITLTEKDALLLENEWIKKYQPKYNILLKDDKTFVSLVVTKHKWPMLKLVRYKGKPKNDGIYFGPYTQALSAKEVFDLVARLFPLRQCSDSELMQRKRPCILYDIKRCIAPCVSLCTEKEYQSHVDKVISLLKGNRKEIVDKLTQEMERASENLEFEKAQEILKKIDKLEDLLEKQNIQNVGVLDTDVIGFYQDKEAAAIQLLMYREGKLMGSKPFSFHLIASSPEEILSSFLLQNYGHAKNLPQEILVPLKLHQSEDLEEILTEAAQRKVTLNLPKTGKKKALLEMAEKNAKALFLQKEKAKGHQEKLLFDLEETCGLSRFPKWIECIDTSHLAGSDPVASLISFVAGEKERSKMRLFKVESQAKGDDYGAMREVLYRHLSRQKKAEAFPDLLILDGGKGHLTVALELFEELSIASIDVIALTKDKGRHDKGLSQEKIYVPHRKDPILLDAHSPLLFFLQRVRDEAHRSAISFQQKRRSKGLIRSALDEIPGIGQVKRKRLLTHFQSVEALKKASAEELSQVKGITKKDLQTLLKWQKKIGS